jgi:photosystem II stability/assembly factor-like uncharacterized protein
MSGRGASLSGWAGPFAVLVLLLALLIPAGAAAAYLPPGSGWDDHSQLPYSYANDISFGDATHGWIVGQRDDPSTTPTTYFGAIVATTDGGATWTNQAPGTTAILNGVSSVGTSQAWAVGDGGHILATADGGSTWTAQTSGTAVDLNDVVFTDALRGWAVGRDGTIRVTANGGATWTGQVSGTTDSLHQASFPDATHGWIVTAPYPQGQPSSIIATGNGGVTWSTQLSGVNDEITAVSFPDATHGWAVTFDGTLYSTSDGGATWGSRQMTDSSNHPTAMVFVDATHGWATGGTENEPWGTYIWATSNGGATWTLQNKGGGPEEGMEAIAFPDLLHGYVAGNSGSVMSTRTGGAAPVTLKISGLHGGRVTLGNRVTASGKVIPGYEAGDRVTVTVQRKRGAHWVAATSSARTQTATGAYSWRYRPTALGTYRMKASVRATTGHPAAKTLWKTFSVR